MHSPDAIAAAALALPPNERAALVLRLVESLDEEVDADAEDAWADEVASRLAALQSGEAEVLPAAQALAEARARLAARRG